MLPQTAIRIIGGALVIQSLLFYAFAMPLTLQIFPGASDEATHVGMVMRRGLAAMSFLAGLVIFLFAMKVTAPPSAFYSAAR